MNDEAEFPCNYCGDLHAGRNPLCEPCQVFMAYRGLVPSFQNLQSGRYVRERDEYIEQLTNRERIRAIDTSDLWR